MHSTQEKMWSLKVLMIEVRYVAKTPEWMSRRSWKLYMSAPSTKCCLSFSFVNKRSSWAILGGEKLVSYKCLQTQFTCRL